MNELPEQLIRRLRKAGAVEDYLQLGDSLWLSQFLPRVQPGAPADQPAPVSDDQPPDATEPDTKSTSPSAAETATTTSTTTPPKTAPVYARTAAGAKGGSTISTTPVRMPGVAALPEAQAISRALRPLKRRAPSRHRTALDEEQTVRQSADSGMLTPVTRPLWERWFDVALVVEDTPSMLVWRETLREFRRLLERHGSFRDVRLWRLQLAAAQPQVISHAGVKQDPRVLHDPAGRRLVIFVSDGVSPSWRNGALASLLQTWAKLMPVVFAQMLSERLWHLTPIGQPLLKSWPCAPA